VIWCFALYCAVMSCTILSNAFLAYQTHSYIKIMTFKIKYLLILKKKKLLLALNMFHGISLQTCIHEIITLPNFAGNLGKWYMCVFLNFSGFIV